MSTTNNNQNTEQTIANNNISVKKEHKKPKRMARGATLLTFEERNARYKDLKELRQELKKIKDEKMEEV